MWLKSLKNSALLVFLTFNSASAQFSERFTLSDSLREISGLEQLDNETFIAINDGGDEARIYLLNRKGKIIHTAVVQDRKNRDWEDLATDSMNLYIADIGNNDSKRKNLSILIIKLEDLKNRKKFVEAEEMKISYEDQQSFPPPNDSLFYDSEAITCVDDSIWIFTKTKARPWDGKAFIYKVPAQKGNYKLTKAKELFIGNDGWWSDAITAVDYHDEHFYILTYNRIIDYLVDGEDLKLNKELKFNRLTQKESVIVFDKKSIFIADEKSTLLGGGSIYKVKWND